jgi:predicted AAA+ superfamily ATPase
VQQVPKEEVIARLRLENPWWQAPNEVPAMYSKWRPRPYLEIFLPLVVNRHVRRAVVLMGPRRVGKTYLIHHAIQLLVTEKKVPPAHICYVSVDNPIYVHLSLEQILAIYSEATGTDISTTPVYVFFDEVQYLRSWEIHLKSLVDTRQFVKCVASGSAAAALRLKSLESGAGRFTDFLLPPVTFYEYLSLLGDEELVVITTREGVGAPSFQVPDIQALNKKFLHYLNFGGYPEVIFSEEIQEDPGRFIKRDIIDKVLLRDLPTLYGIDDIQELNSLFTTLAYNTAQEITIDDLSRNSGAAKQTIKKYIEYLEAAFLIRTIHRVDHNAKRFERIRAFKVYLTNSSMRTALFSPLSDTDDRMGALVETGIFTQWFHHHFPEQLHYARWKEGEIDIVSLGPDQVVRWAAEVKWSDRFVDHKEELAESIRFCIRNKISALVVTTKTKEETYHAGSLHVTYHPAALYAFTLGYNIINGKRRDRSEAAERRRGRIVAAPPELA